MSLSHLSPSFHILAPTDPGMSLTGWRCRVWQVDPYWQSDATKPLHHTLCSTGQLVIMEGSINPASSVIWKKLLLPRCHISNFTFTHFAGWVCSGSRGTLCVAPHHWPLQFCGVALFPSFSFQALLVQLHCCVRLNFSLRTGLFLLLCLQDSGAVQINSI